MNIQHFHGVPPLYTNTFLIITNAKHGIIIDAAAEPETYLKALDEAGATLTHILQTHGHFDHVGAVASLKKTTGCKVYMDKIDAEGSQLLPLTPDVITDEWPANGELVIDELRFEIYRTPAIPKAASACPAMGFCSAATRCLQAPAGARISRAAVCRRCRKASPCWQSCRCPMQQPSCPGMGNRPPLGKSATPILT